MPFCPPVILILLLANFSPYYHAVASVIGFLSPQQRIIQLMDQGAGLMARALTIALRSPWRSPNAHPYDRLTIALTIT